MKRIRGALVGAGLVLAACSSSGTSPPPTTTTLPPGPGAFTFAVWGDTPYSQAETATLPRLVGEINAARPAFVVHVGDIAGGGACDDAVYATTAATFNTFTAPLVYVPGDNEWTDCHRGGFDPVERLGHLRRTMYPSSASFGSPPLELIQQRPDFPENSRWTHGSVVFVGLNVPGSNNNRLRVGSEAAAARTPAEVAAAEAESTARDEANRAWLRQGFEAAVGAGATGVVVVMQADPAFDVPPADRVARNVDGYDGLLAAFVEEAKAFAKPVVIVHGDSHQYRFDRPLVDPATAQIVANVQRVETYGSPVTGWVRVTVDPTSAAFVRAEPEFVGGPRG